MKFSKTFEVDYGTHKYTETWELDGELYCPHCGEQSVWVDQSPGDYYVGVQHVCTECRWSFYLPSSNEVTDKHDLQRIAKLSE